MEKDGNVREALVLGAIQVFAKRGYRVPVRTLAAELGVTTGAIYHHFGDKRALFLEGVALALGGDEADMDVPGPDVSVADRARRFARAARDREALWVTRILTLHEFVRSLDGPTPGELVHAMDRYAEGTALLLGSSDRNVGILANNWVTGMVLRRHLDDGRTKWEDQVDLFVRAMCALV